jgi:hypothetical protein
MAENERFGRQPIQIVEIDQDFCTRRYGASSGQTAYGLVGERPPLISTGFFGDMESTAEISQIGGEATLRICDETKPDNLSSRIESQALCEGFISEIQASKEMTFDVWMSPERRQELVGQSRSPIFSISNGDKGYLFVEYSQRPQGGTGAADNAIYFVCGNQTSSGLERVASVSVLESDGLPPPSEVTDGTLKRLTITVSGGGPGSGGGSTANLYWNGTLLRSRTLIDEASYLGNWGSNTTPPLLAKIGGRSPEYPLDQMELIEINRLRIYSKALSQSEIDQSSDGSVADTASLLVEAVDDTSYSESSGCNAARSTNLLKFSEMINSDGWIYSDIDILPNTVGYEGLIFNNIKPSAGETSAGARSELSGFKVEPGTKVQFRAVVKKTDYAATLTLQHTLTIELGGFLTSNQIDLDINPQTGALVSDNSSSPDLSYVFDIQDLGDYFLASLTFDSPVADEQAETQDTAFFGISGATDSDILSVGGLIVTLDPDDDYTKTSGVRKLKTGTDKCFNTRSTCQDPDNYDKGVQVLRFVEKTSEIPTDALYWPMVTGVSVTPAKLNPGGANSNARALGQRASLSVRFQDHPGNDRIVDPYVADRDYNPLERGTWWTKWRARNPYYMQRPLRLRSGYMVNGQVVDEITRDFVITGFSGPDSNGNVSIQGKDVLTLAEDEKAQAPVASRGKLSADLTAGATSATLTPVGIGDDEYPATGFVRVGKEVMAFTRTGDNLTLTRGQFGTEAKEHDEDDSVQLCLRYVSQAPQDILYDLLLNYANIPAEYLDKAQWDAEALDFLPRLYSAIITEPNGVSKLISEMCQQMYFTIWWDERLGKVILKSVRLAQEDEVFELDDQKHLIADSVSWKDLADELITQVWVYYGQLDPTEKLDQGSNYATIAITADPSAEGADKHNLRRIKTIFSRWIDATNASAAEDLGQRILNRYGNAPRLVTFRVDAKDRYLWLGDYIRLTNRLRVDQFGRAVPVNLQIFEAEEAALGSEFRFTAQEFIPALIGGDQVEDPNERVIPITSDLLNVNLRTLHDSLFGAPAGTENITFVIREGVTIGGDAAGGGVNVAAGARNSNNDFTSGGNSVIVQSALGRSFNGGLVANLQRASISSARSFSNGDSYPGLGAVDYAFSEYPTSVALDTGIWPPGVTLKLIIEAGAQVIGEGGTGSGVAINSPIAMKSQDAVFWAEYPAVPGGDGGDAMRVQADIEITNGGLIANAGGGGAAACFTLNDAFLAANSTSYVCVSGGGGSGYWFGRTATNKITSTRRKSSYAKASSIAQPAQGARLSGGQRGEGRVSGGVARSFFNDDPVASTSNTIRSGAGGTLTAGGTSQVIGSATSDFSFSYNASANSGGQPGKAIRAGANLITWVNKGDVRGDEVA